MSFRFEIGARTRAASRFVSNVRSDLVAAIMARRTERGITQQQLAEFVGVSRRDLNSYLCGQRELPLRSIADLAWALDKEIHVELRDLIGAPDGGCGSEPETRAALHPVCSSGVATWSSSRAIRTIVVRTNTDQDE